MVGSDLGSNSTSYLENSMKRISATELVAKSAVRPATLSWYTKLPEVDRQYIRDVIAAMKLSGVTTFHSVSLALQSELKLNVSLTSIKNTIRNLYKWQDVSPKS
jgi:hypothetical protein